MGKWEKGQKLDDSNVVKNWTKRSKIDLLTFFALLRVQGRMVDARVVAQSGEVDVKPGEARSVGGVMSGSRSGRRRVQVLLAGPAGSPDLSAGEVERALCRQ